MGLFTKRQAATLGADMHDAPAVVIGSSRTIAYVRRLLRQSSARRRGHRVIGCVLLRGEGRRSVGSMCVLGTVDQLDLIVRAHRVRLAFVCIPVSMHTLTARITSRLAELGVDARRVVTVADQLDGRLSHTRGSLDTAALLDRTPRPLDEDAIAHVLSGKRVMITGAGGSIGSELAHIVARFAPESLALMERAENNLFEIDRRLAGQFPALQRRAMLHDVADAARTLALVRRYRPDVVFHAAAHKHVPMMEDHPRQALVNNFIGTRSIADAAAEAGAERFVMISTDKAVRPTSVMGATKRAAELYVQDLDRRTATRCVMVRFGNVLGSACSVIPIWQQQLGAGGPITVTDGRMTRFFMTINEAASLVIQAAALEAEGGSIFVLDMGRPVRIVDMAERFIRAHGLEPGREVEIVFTGVRPGEKLHEELSYEGEEVERTAHPSVRLLRAGRPPEAHVAWMIETFERLADCDERGAILAALRRAVPEMLAPADAMTDDAEEPLAATIGRVAAAPISRSA